jgi:hypothetical protein
MTHVQQIPQPSAESTRYYVRDENGKYKKPLEIVILLSRIIATVPGPRYIPYSALAYKKLSGHCPGPIYVIEYERESSPEL